LAGRRWGVPAREEFSLSEKEELLTKVKLITSVGDPNPHIFGPSGSGSISQRYGSGSFPFLIKLLSRLK
jgi:hypothetical protein